MAWPNIFQRGTLFSRFSHHHVVVFLLTFFRYSLLHTSRKTFSNVKVSISKQWTPSAFNKSISLPVEIWSSNHLFPRAEEATLFLGTLDTIFLFSYAVGLFISGIVGDRLMMGSIFCWTRSCFWSLECLCFSGQYFGSMPSFFCSAIRL
uniref:Uncharacterized protein n=3 Tax=Canis lupus TaxID=9612 RepID=A0A8C0S3F0_CANLF